MSINVSADQLRQFLERIEMLEEEKRGLADDIKGVFAEAKSVGFDVKTLRRLVAWRRLDSNARAEQAALFETYAAAIGFDSTPLGSVSLNAQLKTCVIVPPPPPDYQPPKVKAVVGGVKLYESVPAGRAA